MSGATAGGGSAYTNATISVLQPLIKKPVLKAALLEKPPFRFLHDIVTSLIASPTAPFPPAALFSPELLQSDTVKDNKELKQAFLTRLIAIVSAVNGQPLDVSVSKILAGAEPEKTNRLLQGLANAALKKLTEDQIISKVDGKGSAATVTTPAPPAAPIKPAPTANDKKKEDKKVEAAVGAKKATTSAAAPAKKEKEKTSPATAATSAAKQPQPAASPSRSTPPPVSLPSSSSRGSNSQCDCQ